MSHETIGVLERLALAYPNQTLSPGTIVVMAEDLIDIPPDVLELICQRLRRTESWFPTIDKFRDMWFEIFEQAMSWPSAAQSLQLCLRTMNEVGSGLYDPVSGRTRCPDEFPDPLTVEAVRIFGWNRIAESDDWLAKEWDKAFQEARNRVRRRFVAEGPIALEMGQPTRRELAVVIGGQLEQSARPELAEVSR